MAASFARLALTLGGSTELAIIAKATIVIGLAILGARLAHGARASVRHALLASSFGVLLLLPVIALLLPPVEVAIPISESKYSVAVPVVALETTAGVVPPASGRGPSAGLRPTTAWAAMLLRAAWAAGAMLCLLPIVVAVWRLRKVRRSGLPWPKGRALARTLAREARISRPVDVLIHEEMQSPVTCGFVRPAIVLPPDATEWSDADIRQAIVHELEHVGRGDWPIHLVTRVMCALYWFHPLVWIAWRHLTLEAERACDDAVLRGAERTAYAEQLVLLAQRLSHGAARPVLSMASRSDLSARISAVLDITRPRGPAGIPRAATIAVAACVLVFGLSPLRAVARVTRQSPPADNAAFEVASVKVNKSGPGPIRIGFAPGGRFTAMNVTLRMLIGAAYGEGRPLPDFQVLGGPKWLESDRFDIVAKAEGNPQPGAEGPPPQMFAMLRTLLADRFKLAVHHETKELPIYALVLVKSDGKLGPTLRRSEVDCAARGARGNAPPPGPPAPGERMQCGIRLFPGNLSGGGLSMAQLASSLARMPGVTRVVVDKTGLTGSFDADLEWTPDQMPRAEQLPPGAPALPPIDPNGPSIFTALQEQLGLKLESQRGPVDVLVIDRAEQPTPD